jgi:spore coat protein A, manganese oxidase
MIAVLYQRIPPGPNFVLALQVSAVNIAPEANERPAYVWHCHILEHEDNEMMRPYKVVG